MEGGRAVKNRIQNPMLVIRRMTFGLLGVLAVISNSQCGSSEGLSDREELLALEKTLHMYRRLEMVISKCHELVKPKLWAPQTANFDQPVCSPKISFKNARTWDVFGCVESKNASRELIRTQWRCEARHESGDDWKLGAGIGASWPVSVTIMPASSVLPSDKSPKRKYHGSMK